MHWQIKANKARFLKEQPAYSCLALLPSAGLAGKWENLLISLTDINTWKSPMHFNYLFLFCGVLVFCLEFILCGYMDALNVVCDQLVGRSGVLVMAFGFLMNSSYLRYKISRHMLENWHQFGLVCDDTISICDNSTFRSGCSDGLQENHCGSFLEQSQLI